jgi:hypothetical protein
MVNDKNPLSDSLCQGFAGFYLMHALQSDVLDSVDAMLAKAAPEVISLRDVLDYSYSTPVTYMLPCTLDEWVSM